MTTHVVSQRFSAQDALTFLQEAIRYVPASTLAEGVNLIPQYDPEITTSIYWDRMPTAPNEVWGPYKTPQLSLTQRLLIIPIRSYALGWKALRWVRRTLRV